MIKNIFVFYFKVDNVQIFPSACSIWCHHYLFTSFLTHNNLTLDTKLPWLLVLWVMRPEKCPARKSETIQCSTVTLNQPRPNMAVPLHWETACEMWIQKKYFFASTSSSSGFEQSHVGLFFTNEKQKKTGSDMFIIFNTLATHACFV